MSDEPIVDYLRSRAQVRPPMDLVGSIADAVQAVPQQRYSWFAPFIPAAAAVGAAAIVVVAAILVGQDGISAPPPGGSPSEGELASPTSEPTAQPTPAPTLVRPGDSVMIDAVDSDGRWGTVRLTRGDDLGGYDDGSVPEDSFVVEMHVQYVAEREPQPFEFGAGDWTLLGGPDGEAIEGRVPPGGRREATRPSLATYPGAIDVFTNALEGWLLFVVPRDAADFPLELRYQPLGLTEPVTTAYVRRPGAPPPPVALATPAPTPAPVTYVELDAYPFSIIESAEADDLFETPDTCTNPVAGYTVTYPDAWFTNTEIGDWPPCSWFSPVFYSVGEDENAVPPQVAIVLTFANTAYGYTDQPEFTVNNQLTVSGFDQAYRTELIGATSPAGEYFPHPPSYFYIVIVGDQPAETPTLRAQTDFDGAAEYELNKAVLDRIMALIEFDE